jgi:hypothetical protein
MNRQSQIAIQQAKAAASRGDYSRARGILRQAARQDPNNEDILLLFAQFAQKREHAIQCYERVLEINPYNEIASRALERAYAQQARRDEFDQIVAKTKSTIGSFDPESAKKVISPLTKIPFKRYIVNTFRTVMVIAILVGGVYLGINAYDFINRYFGLGSYAPTTPTPNPNITPTPTVPVDLPLLQSEFMGRISIMEGDPALFENVWDLISVDSFNTYAYASENADEYWFDAVVNLRVGFQRTHPVRFRLTITNPATGISSPLLLEETIVPNHELGLGANSLQVTRINFYLFVSGDYGGKLELDKVEIVRIDGMRQDEWEPPEGAAGKFRDVWKISNPHDIALPLAWELVKRDQAGNTIGLSEYKFCLEPQSDFEALYREFSLLPPGKHIIISENIDPDEEQNGVTTELTLRYPDECQPLLQHEVAYDPNVVLVDTPADSDEAGEGNGAEPTEEPDPYTQHLVIENRSLNEAFGLFYVNIYDQNDNPIAGRAITLDPSSFPLLPDEFLELSPRLDFIELVEPTPTRFEFVFLGMSQIPEQPTPSPTAEGDLIPAEEILTPEPTSAD